MRLPSNEIELKAKWTRLSVWILFYSTLTPYNHLHFTQWAEHYWVVVHSWASYEAAHIAVTTSKHEKYSIVHWTAVFLQFKSINANFAMYRTRNLYLFFVICRLFKMLLLNQWVRWIDFNMAFDTNISLKREKKITLTYDTRNHIWNVKREKSHHEPDSINIHFDKVDHVKEKKSYTETRRS